MEEYSSNNNIELDAADKKIFEEIKRLAETNNVGETIKNISHAINGYLHKSLLATGNLEDELAGITEKQKEDFKKITQNSLKISLVVKELRKLYHL